MIRLGVIGHGNRISGVIKHCLRQVEPGVRVVGIVDPDEKGARSRLAECDQKDVVFYASLDEMVRKAKLDALAVGTRCNLHAPYGIQAAKYDIPLYLEKPVAVDMKQATGLEAAFKKSKCQVVVSFPLRVSPLCVLTRQYIEEGAVGSPEHIAAVNYVPYGTGYYDGGYRNYKITQGLFLQKATHDFDYMMYLMGGNVVRVAAMWNLGRIFGGKKPAGLVCSKCDEAETCPESPENRKRNASGGRAGDHPCLFGKDVGSPKTGMNEDSSSALLEFASGVHGVYTQVFYSRRDAGTRGAIISGYHGTLKFDWYTNELRRIRHHVPFSDTIKASGGASHFGGDSELAHDFIALVKGKGKSRTPIWTGIQSVYTCLACKESAQKGRFVKVRQVAGR
ncbi:MAG: Gfo/Idh/MocA family oxidoreductase [Planctomycetes bacterium]|nr:Gfo/Idh/MocA family oxidoreductase [Planctomycetota bacterium]